MGNVVTPILNGLGFANVGNAALSTTRGATEQILKTASSPADAISGLNDLTNKKGVRSFIIIFS